MAQLNTSLNHSPSARYALGLDFGTESVRALVVDIDNGDEAAQHSVSYPSGVISRRLPGASHDLPPDFALQDPRDYMNSCIEAISAVLKKVPASSIFGIGVDFTACTILPVLKDGTPLMMLPELQSNPHAWVKLWKHHGAKLEADRINELGRDRKEGFLKYYQRMDAAKMPRNSTPGSERIRAGGAYSGCGRLDRSAAHRHLDTQFLCGRIQRILERRIRISFAGLFASA
jgi:sugar (pentulose or hexulose) kinase